MLNFLTSLILASLLIPAGFNFLTDKAVDYSYRQPNVGQAGSPQRLVNESFGLKTTAKSILIVDDNSGSVLYNKNSLAITPIASITKLMTALVILDTKPDWEQVVKISPGDKREGGMIYLMSGEEATVKDLFYLMLIGSANEAAVALARNSGITEFNAAMNKKAKELGMTNSYFLEPSGIDPLNVSSPADLLKLAQAAFAKPEITQALTTEIYKFQVINNQRQVKVFSTDRLLDSFLNGPNYQVLGAKTGYLDEAGYCLLLRVQKISGPSLTLVLLGSETIDDRWQEAKGLVEWVFRNYSWPE
ncbi:MAG: serine hydrolase [Patescibacteria group bacterium]|jgi:D-alanyl-D-alanine carboxypeptidase